PVRVGRRHRARPARRSARRPRLQRRPPARHVHRHPRAVAVEPARADPVVRALAVVALLAAVARAQEPPVPIRPLRFADKAGQLVVSGSFTAIFDDDLVEQLGNGFAQTLFVRAWLWREGAELPIWFTAATYRVLYAQWDEVYYVRVRDPTGERNAKLAARAEALREAATLRELPVAPLDRLEPGGSYFLGVIVEVNPVTPELVAEVRRWLTRPPGRAVGGDSFFGSFVSIFVNPKVPTADRTLRFRSQ